MKEKKIKRLYNVFGTIVKLVLATYCEYNINNCNKVKRLEGKQKLE